MKHIYKILLLLVSYAMHLLALFQIANVLTTQDIIGANAATFLNSYGITQIILAAIMLLVALIIFITVLIILIREATGKAPVSPPVKVSSSVKKLETWIAKMEKTYGADWMSKQEAVASAISQSKKK